MYKIIASDQKEYGPVDADVVRQWITAGRATAKTMACRCDAAGWKPLEAWPEFGELFSAPRPNTAVPPPISAPVPPSTGGGMNTIIPYRNPLALAAYYLGVFSLIPFLGIVLGLLAFVLGILGLRFRRRNPSAGGKVHAWIGIIVGGLFGFGYLGITLWIVFASLAHKRY